MNVHATSQSVQGANTGWQRESGAIETGSSATDVRALVGTLLRRLPIIFGVPIIAVTLSMALYSILPSRYTASLTLLIDPKPTSKLGPDVDSSWATVDGNRINSIVSVLQSSMLMSRVVKSANLVADPEFSGNAASASSSGGLRSTLLSWVPFIGQKEVAPPISDAMSQENKIQDVVDRLRPAVVVTRDNFSYVLKIDVSSRSAAKAALIANTVGDEYLNDQLEARYDAAKRASSWLSDRLADLRAELQRSE